MASLQFNIQFANLQTVPSGSTLNYRAEPTTTSAVIAVGKPATSLARTTGGFINQPDGKWWQVVLNPPNGKTAYVRGDVVKLYKPTSDSITKETAQGVVDSLIKNDVEVFHALARITALIEARRNAGKDVKAYEEKLKALYDRYAARQLKIKDSKLISFKEGLKAGYEKIVTGFKSFLKNKLGIGAFPFLAPIIYGAIGATTAVICYYVFKPSYDESKTDLIVTKELEDLLSKADTGTANKIKKDLEKQVDTAYNQGKTDGKFSGMLGILKPILIMGAAFLLVTSFVKSKSK